MVALGLGIGFSLNKHATKELKPHFANMPISELNQPRKGSSGGGQLSYNPVRNTLGGEREDLVEEQLRVVPRQRQQNTIPVATDHQKEQTIEPECVCVCVSEREAEQWSGV